MELISPLLQLGKEESLDHKQKKYLSVTCFQRHIFPPQSYTDEDHGLVGVRPHLYHGLEKFLQENML